MEPDKHAALNNWGIALKKQAETKHGEEADRLLAAAIEKYRTALEIKPDKHEALYNWGAALMEQAETKSDGEAEALYRAVAEKLARVEALAPGRGAYNLACLAALQGRGNEARSWLLKSRNAGRLPNRAHLEQDTDLDRIRDTRWFRKLLSEL
ncbi:MAG: tetratricopeptide repeat protein [Candidatus Thiosymbion ectosymbiont of Robbea hypermnestra]|nr:tetratricopeptide repeat protein [Candidatus Thiosymbion ectosymbiont of Robbea hypermnestra]